MPFISGRYATKDIELFTAERSQVSNYKHTLLPFFNQLSKKSFLSFLNCTLSFKINIPFFRNFMTYKSTTLGHPS